VFSKGIPLIACAVIAVTLHTSSVLAAANGQDHRACTSVDMNSSPARKQEYARLVADAVGQKVRPSNVTIQTFLSSGSWSVVYADTPVADPGYFFFQTVEGRKRFKDVWGGMAQSSDRPELIAWAKKRGAPDSLAVCFAHVVIGG
jgi:hypothetical protein